MNKKERKEDTQTDEWEKEFKEMTDQFVNVAVCGKGTYGCVYKVYRRKNPNKFYAIKKIELMPDKEGFPLTAVREIGLLKRLKHPNIISLKEVFASKPSKWNQFKRSSFLVMEYMEHDLLTIMRHERFRESEVKRIMKDILNGLVYLHGLNIIHRDLKCGNLLMNKYGEVKIADFGLARVKNVEYLTQNVVTFWYRAPELLLGKKTYDEKIDIWSLGCIFAELLTNEVLFMGQEPAQQMVCIYRRLGNPEPQWPEVTVLPWWKDFSPKSPFDPDLEMFIRKKCTWADVATIDLLKRMLEYSPAKRISAEEATKHPYFKNPPAACDPRDLGRYQKEYHQHLLKQPEKKKKREEIIDRSILQNKEFQDEKVSNGVTKNSEKLKMIINGAQISKNDTFLQKRQTNDNFQERNFVSKPS